MKTKKQIENEYWNEKLHEIYKICNNKRDKSINKKSLKLENVAIEIANALREEIPAKSVKVMGGDSFNGEDIRALKVEIHFYDNAVLEFTSFWYDRIDCSNPMKQMWLIFSNAGLMFPLDVFDYKTIIEEFIYFYKHYKLYCDEIYPALYESEKQEKIRQTAKTTIHTIIPKLMAQTNYEWILKDEEERSVLQVKMKRGKMLEITLGYKSFTEKIQELLNVIKQMDEIISEMPYPVDMKSYGRSIKWNKKT